MDYELAKELKDAGWNKGELRHVKGTEAEFLYDPTLSELIEACGGVLLWGCKHNGYYASKQFCPEEYPTLKNTFDGSLEADAKGKTPEEAVARLWLALTSKHN